MNSSLRTVRTPEDIAGLIEYFGFFPFFKNRIGGFSLEERTPPELWFEDDGEGHENGVWDWKSTVISDTGCAYGRFAAGKACFVSREWYPDLMNVQRSRGTLTGTESEILDIIRGEDSVLSSELKVLSGYAVPRGREQNLSGGPLIAMDREAAALKKEGFETALGRLQQRGRVIISDFEYRMTKAGIPYGWGIARYCTPESVFGFDALETGRTAEESEKRILMHLKSVLPEADERDIRRLFLK